MKSDGLGYKSCTMVLFCDDLTFIKLNLNQIYVQLYNGTLVYMDTPYEISVLETGAVGVSLFHQRRTLEKLYFCRAKTLILFHMLLMSEYKQV